MHLVRRPLAPEDIDYELVWLLVSAGTFALVATWLALKLPWPVCIFHVVTGRPCLTCGATRAAVAFFQGRFFTAWKWNPLACVSYCAIVVFNVYAVIVLITRAPRLRFTQSTPAQRTFFRLVALFILMANWIYLLTANQSY